MQIIKYGGINNSNYGTLYDSANIEVDPTIVRNGYITSKLEQENLKKLYEKGEPHIYFLSFATFCTKKS